jgi:hypothetical protein
LFECWKLIERRRFGLYKEGGFSRERLMIPR